MIYLDNNATTPVLPEALEALLPFYKESFGNPSSVHSAGQQGRRAVEAARAEVAALVGAQADEVVFTSCGSEANSLALFGAAHAAVEQDPKKDHVLVSAIEHDSIREASGVLRRRGFRVEEVPVDGAGRVDPEQVARMLTDATCLVSVMAANNEVGTVQPVRELAALCRAKGALFHTDAVQAAGKVPVDFMGWGVDLLSLAGHKFGAPKGVGALVVRRGVALQPLVTGNHEKNRRGGTLNVAGIAALGVAARVAREELAGRTAAWRRLRERLEQGVLAGVEDARVSGGAADRLPNTAHFCFDGVDGHSLVVALDLEGICVSGGSACSSGASKPSHVLAAMGLAKAASCGALRVSFGRQTTEADIDALVKALPAVVAKLRKVRELL